MANLIKEKIRTTIEKLCELSVLDSLRLDGFKCISTGYKKEQRPPMPDASWSVLSGDERFDGIDEHFWIYKRIKTPTAPNSTSKLYFDLKTGREGQWDARNPQFLAFLDGHAVQGLDVNHTDLELEFDREYDFHLYMYTGLVEGSFALEASYKMIDTAIEKLYYDMQVPFESLDCLSDSSEEYVTIQKYLELTCNYLDLRIPYSNEFYDSLKSADEFLETEFYCKQCGRSDCTVSCIGHTHIDVAWQWTLAQTEEKTQRSFATMLKLMDQYDEFKFMSSQPQLYKYLKRFEPELYEKVKQRIKEGRWEAEGAMWLEADCNLSSGESFVRQILFGKTFFMDEFGVDSKVLWLPDVFGYSAALPQILKKSGVDKFVTSKISWNDTNVLPYDVFMWEGIDGTEIFTSFMTAQDYREGTESQHFTTYNAHINPSQVMGTRKRFQQKEYSKNNLLTFGYGDGGGGSTRKMIEYHMRLKRGIPGIPATVIEFAGDFLDKFENDFKESSATLKKMPRWVGELYLEFHRGTYTSMAKNKKNNRKSELLFQTAEQLSSMTNILTGADYPQQDINDSWETILLNQFHDIIPGSSIEEVYNDSDIQYAHIKNVGSSIVSSSLQALASRISSDGCVAVYNPNSFTSSGIIELNGKSVYVENIPAIGWKSVSEVKDNNNITVSANRIDSKFYTITLDSNANITSIYDKENDREVILPGKAANAIEAFEDLPYNYDNWELSPYYKQKKWDINNVDLVECINDGARAGLRIVRRFLNSTIAQSIYVYDDLRRIDFETDIDWKESHIVLKAAFPINVHASKAVYETQFGYVERTTHENTSFDSAKFEVCAHKYADISEDDYGVAILNDCKYGYNAEGNTLKLTLLKCGTFPNKNADKERHLFTYSLLPHSGNHTHGNVIQEAYLLNRPLMPFTPSGDGSLPNEYSLVSCDKENIIIETVKKAEKSDNIVIRAYDAYDRKCKAVLSLGFDIKKAHLTDLMENKICELEIIDGNKIPFNVSNFEIVTIMVER